MVQNGCKIRSFLPVFSLFWCFFPWFVDIWYVEEKPEEINRNQTLRKDKNLWHIEEYGNSSDRKKVGEEAATVRCCIDQDLTTLKTICFKCSTAWFWSTRIWQQSIKMVQTIRDRSTRIWPFRINQINFPPGSDGSDNLFTTGSESQSSMSYDLFLQDCIMCLHICTFLPCYNREGGRLLCISRLPHQPFI